MNFTPSPIPGKVGGRGRGGGAMAHVGYMEERRRWERSGWHCELKSGMGT